MALGVITVYLAILGVGFAQVAPAVKPANYTGDPKAALEENKFAMPWMVAINIYDACTAGQITGAVCDHFTLLSTSCKDQGMESMGGCVEYMQVCGLAGACAGFGPITSAPDTMVAQANLVEALCTPAVCGNCTGISEKCPDTLGTLSKVCTPALRAAATGHPGCAKFDAMCKAHPELTFYCGAAAV